MKTSSVSHIEPMIISSNAAHNQTGAPPARRKNKKRAEDRPKRPLSAYNIFFQLARATILAGDHNLSNVETLSSLDLTNLVIDRNGKTKEPSKSKKGQRGTSVKMGFKGLATTIANKWKSIQPALKALFVERANVEKLKFNRELEHWNGVQLAEKGAGSRDSSKHPQNTLLTIQSVNSPGLSRHPSMVTSCKQQQHNNGTSSFAQSEDAFASALMFLPSAQDMQHFCASRNAPMVPPLDVPGPQAFRLPQLQQISATLPFPSISQGAPQSLPQCQDFRRLDQPVMLSRMPSSIMNTQMLTSRQPAMMGSGPAIYPEGLQTMHNREIPPTLHQMECSSPTGCTNNGSISLPSIETSAYDMWQPVSAPMFPFQGLQGAQVTRVSQPGDALIHRQISSCSLPIPCTNLMTSLHPRPMVGVSPAMYPPRLPSTHDSEVPLSFEDVPCPTPIGCLSNSSIVFSQDSRLWAQNADDQPVQQGRETASLSFDNSSLLQCLNNARIVSPGSDNNAAGLPVLQLGAPVMHVVGAETEEQSIANFSFDIQDGFGWNETSLFPE